VATEAVIYVAGLDAMSVFYRRCIGLVEAETGDVYRGLRADGVTVWLVRGGQGTIAGLDGDSRRRRSETPIKLAFQVRSIEQIAPAIISLGGSIRPNSWQFAGYHRRDAVDPEGNVLQLLEPLASSR
jgi:predicted enzyme related to lactoylglutathione lyase